MIIVLLLLLRSSYAAEGRYECGPNGRFEYCIDDIPGCVVGCHCYPGYYFDTDTKICEPNTKLTQDFRRHYQAATTQHASATTVPDITDATKDNDDLSDWLYNQFFKTIENQVVNKTDDEDLTAKETRRSGGPVIKRRFKKKNGRKSSKKTKKALRRKLLRISEDDSMFDSESESDSSSGSSSWENWSRGDDEKAPKPDRPRRPYEHNGGHRKIVVFSKKPKPPLPSFIFLPNIETPFYPPIGLPIPPLPAPMYPMVPIPPIQPPQAESTSPTPTTTAPPSEKDTAMTHGIGTETTKPSEEPTDAPVEEPIEVPTEDPTGEPVDNPTGEPPEVPTDDATGEPTEVPADNPTEVPANGGGAERKRLLRERLRNKMLNQFKQRKQLRNSKRKKRPPGKVNRNPGKNPFNIGLRKPQFQKTKFINPFNTPFQNLQLKNTRLNNPQLKKPQFGSDDAVQQPILEDDANHGDNEVDPLDSEVNFNYLSQLIHRVDLHETTPSSPPVEFNDKEKNLMEFLNPTAIPGQRRGASGNAGGVNPRRSLGGLPPQPEDSYYTKLGREIAKLVRDIHPDHAEESPAFLGDYSSKSRSYWERFVRSPIKLRIDNYSKLGNIKSSNENLFDLENKVEVAAERSSVLSLPELENVINAMKKTQYQAHSHKTKVNNRTPSNISLNISLLPRQRAELKHVAKKSSSVDVSTQNSKTQNRRSLINQKDLKRNDVKPANTSGYLNSSIRNEMNHAINNFLTSNLVAVKNVQHYEYNSNFENSLPLGRVAPNIVPNNVKNPNQLQPAIIQHQNVNHYYGMYNNLYPDLAAFVTESYRPYIDSKPSYFFNEFDYFV